MKGCEGVRWPCGMFRHSLEVPGSFHFLLIFYRSLPYVGVVGMGQFQVPTVDASAFSYHRS